MKGRTTRQQIADHRRRLRSMRKTLHSMAAAWEGWDYWLEGRFDDLIEQVDILNMQLADVSASRKQAKKALHGS